MSEPTAIAEVEERLSDLNQALCEAGRPDLARLLEHHAQDFTSVALVRRSVNAIRHQLELWRGETSELPDTAKVQFAANRLEDVCREALDSGVIVAARPSIGTHARRKLNVVLVTLLSAAVVMLLAIALVESGIELDEIGAAPPREQTELPRGNEIEVEITALADSLVPEATTAALLLPAARCMEGVVDTTCAPVEERAWPEGRLPTYEIKLPSQAYGLLFSIRETLLYGGRVARGKVLIAATDDTPEGRYEILLRAQYSGYTPQRCEWFDRMRNACPAPRTGKGERHASIAVPALIVDVTPPDPNRARKDERAAEAEAAERRALAAERAVQIESALAETSGAVAEAEKLVRKQQWETARERLQKLGELFAPLDSAALVGEAPGALPAEVGKLRARYEELHEQVQELESRVFDMTFNEVTAATNKAVAEERILGRVAKRFRISSDYVQMIYTDRAEEIQKRLEARTREHLAKVRAEQDAREARCGPLPSSAWELVNGYLQRTMQKPGLEIELGECMTPRLSADACWELECDYRRRQEIAVERPKVVTKHRLIARIVKGRVVGH